MRGARSTPTSTGLRIAVEASRPRPGPVKAVGAGAKTNVPVPGVRDPAPVACGLVAPVGPSITPPPPPTGGVAATSGVARPGRGAKAPAPRRAAAKARSDVVALRRPSAGPKKAPPAPPAERKSRAGAPSGAIQAAAARGEGAVA